jgi:hypothetical protein
MIKFFVDPDISKARTIDSSIYTSQQLFDEMKDKMFLPAGILLAIHR